MFFCMHTKQILIMQKLVSHWSEKQLFFIFPGSKVHENICGCEQKDPRHRLDVSPLRRSKRINAEESWEIMLLSTFSLNKDASLEGITV